MSKQDHHGVKSLAAAIRKGAERRPDQAFGDYFVGRRASCALGAAYEGMYRLAEDMDGRGPTKDLGWFFDCLENVVRFCPAKDCRKHLVLSSLIVHLNDAHHWTRDEIATWLEELNGKNGTRPSTPAAP